MDATPRSSKASNNIESLRVSGEETFVQRECVIYVENKIDVQINTLRSTKWSFTNSWKLGE